MSEVEADSLRDAPPVLIPARDDDLGTGIPEPAEPGVRLGVWLHPLSGVLPEGVRLRVGVVGR